jgi:pimeloyl-ACP methyl ester carboxylesterase
MSDITAGLLRVPGATIFHESRGAGPVLLMVQGRDGAHDGTAGIATHLAEHFTVVSYDRRGLSGSKLDPGAVPPNIATHADDAYRLLEATTSEPAFVFGASIGALIGLDLLARHPDRIRLLVAHEPPATEFLPDGERANAAQSQLDVEDAGA